MAGRPGCASAEGDMDSGTGPAERTATSSITCGTRSRPRRVRGELEGCRCRAGRGGEGHEGDLPPSVSDARVDGHCVRRRGRSGESRNRLVADPGGLSVEKQRCVAAGHTGGERTRHLHERFGLLRLERGGHRLVRRGADVPGRRPARPRAIDAPDEMAWENYGAAYVIDQRVGLDANGNLVAWDYEAWSPTLGNRPGNDTPGNVITGTLAGRQPAAFAPRGPASEPAGFNNGSNAAPSYVAGCVGGRCGGGGTIRSERVLSHTVKSLLLHRAAAIARAPPEYVRPRELHGRDRRRGESGSGRVPAAPSESSAIDRRVEGGDEGGELGCTAVAEAGHSPNRRRHRSRRLPAWRTKATTDTARWSPKSPSIRTPAP